MQRMSNGRVRRSPEEWRELVERFAGSGLNRREFCRREKISVNSLQRWRQRLTASARSEFVEVAPAKGDRASSPWVVEVELAGGTIVRIRS